MTKTFLKHDNWHRYPVGKPLTTHKCYQACLCAYPEENDDINPDCPIHGNPTTRPRCSHCGKFMPGKPSS